MEINTEGNPSLSGIDPNRAVQKDNSYIDRLEKIKFKLAKREEENGGPEGHNPCVSEKGGIDTDIEEEDQKRAMFLKWFNYPALSVRIRTLKEFVKNL